MAGRARERKRVVVKILCIDIETSPNLAHVWGLWQQNVSLGQLRASTEMICFASKWLGQKKVDFYSTFHNGRQEMVERAHALLDEADVVMGYNSKSFDVKHLNREFLEAGLKPPSPYKQIDLMLAVKKNFRLPSNKLQYVSTLLGLAGKVSHEGHELWVKCLAGDEAAWKRMAKYNRQDVVLLEEVYEHLQPWIGDHPNVALHEEGGTPVCPRCGSEDLRKQGFRYTTVSKFQQYQCRKCGGWTSSGKRVEGADLRPVAA